ncbi:MAG: hypothetical protein WC601_03795 [Desulfotomaculaceae bacterium]
MGRKRLRSMGRVFWGYSACSYPILGGIEIFNDNIFLQIFAKAFINALVQGWYIWLMIGILLIIKKSLDKKFNKKFKYQKSRKLF